MLIEGQLHHIALAAARKPLEGDNGTEGPYVGYLRAVSAYSGEYSNAAILRFAPIVLMAGTQRATLGSVYAGIRRVLELLECQPEDYERDLDYLASMDNSHARAVSVHLRAVSDWRIKNKGFYIESSGLSLGLWVRSVGLHEHAAEILGEMLLWEAQKKENAR